MRLLVYVAASSALMLLAACGSSGAASEPSATAGSPPDEASPSATATAEPTAVDGDEALIAFAQCMREEGIDYPDPQPGQGGLVYTASDDPRYEDALDSCRSYLVEATHDLAGDPANFAEQQDRMLEIARCIRDKGFDFPDPVISASGDVMLGGPQLDLNDPDVRAATQDCVLSVLGSDIAGPR